MNYPTAASLPHSQTCIPVNYILRCVGVCNAFQGIVMCTFLLWDLLLLSENNFKSLAGLSLWATFLCQGIYENSCP